MTRLIDADALKNEMLSNAPIIVGNFYKILEKIDEAPTVERPHGEWEFIGENLFKCTNCGYVADADYLRKWKVHTYDAEFPTACLNCGADMRKER